MTRGCIVDSLASLYILEDLAYFSVLLEFMREMRNIFKCLLVHLRRKCLGGYKYCWDDTPPSKIVYSGLHL
jgi:hypothetical protein